MTNPNNLKQDVPFQKQVFPFTSLFIQPLDKQALHLHWHDEWEIIYMTKGKATFHIGTEVFCANPGDLIFVNKGLTHTGFVDGDTLVEYYAIIFHPDLVGNLMSDYDNLEIISRYKSGKYVFPTHLTPNDLHYDTFLHAAKDLISEYEQQSPGFQVAIKSLLHLLLVNTTRYYPLEAPDTLPGGYDKEMDEKFKLLISYIEENYADKITLEEASKIANLSTYHFCRTFKKITGKTFVEYLNLYRINVAENMLLNTNDPVTQIAFDVGFGSINYFSQMFKQFKLVSPSQFRKKADKVAVLN